MHPFAQFLALCALSLVAIGYVSLNVVAARFLIRHGAALLRSVATPFRRRLRVQLQAITALRIWSTVALHIGCGVALVMMLREPMSLFGLASLLLGYIFIVSTVTLSLLFQIPFLRSLWNDVVVKLGLLVVPIYFGFVAKGYAATWVEELLGTSSANAGYALFAAASFLLCVIVATLLAVAALLSEAALILTPLGRGAGGSSAKRVGLGILAASSFVATMLGAYAAAALPASRTGNVLLAAIAFEFDASPAGHCELDASEQLLAAGPEPVLKALHLASSQERALLVQRSPSLFRQARLSDLRNAASDDRQLRLGRVAECYKSRPPLVETSTTASSPKQDSLGGMPSK